MSRNIDVFVGTAENLEDFIRELESLLNIKLKIAFYGHNILYEYYNSRIVLSVGDHDYDNDRDMNFEDYQYDIEIRAVNRDTEEERKKWREDFSYLVFNKLKEMGRYKLMMVDNLQIKLKEFHPQTSGV